MKASESSIDLKKQAKKTAKLSGYSNASATCEKSFETVFEIFWKQTQYRPPVVLYDWGSEKCCHLKAISGCRDEDLGKYGEWRKGGGKIKGGAGGVSLLPDATGGINCYCLSFPVFVSCSRCPGGLPSGGVLSCNCQSKGKADGATHSWTHANRGSHRPPEKILLHVGHSTFLLFATTSTAFNVTLEDRVGQGVMSGDLTDHFRFCRLMVTRDSWWDIRQVTTDKVVCICLSTGDPEEPEALHLEHQDPSFFFCYQGPGLVAYSITGTTIDFLSILVTDCTGCQIPNVALLETCIYFWALN